MQNKKSLTPAVAGLFIAIVAVLQLASSLLFKLGVLPPISLVLVPIVLCAALFGTKMSTLLGFVFGLVTFVAGITGLDGFTLVLWQSSPPLTVAITLTKATAAGLVAGLICEAFKAKNERLGIVVAAVLAPIVNTGIFCLFMLFPFKSVLQDFAGGTNILTYLIVTLVGTNFVIEFILDIILAPAVHTVVKATKKYIGK